MRIKCSFAVDQSFLLGSYAFVGALSVLVVSPVWALVPLCEKGTAKPGCVSVVAKKQNDITQVTAIQLNPTPKGLEVILKTSGDRPLQIFPSSYRRTFVANITNTQLALPEGQSFRQENPVPGVAILSVTPQGANSIRVAVTGTSELPKVEVGRSDRSLVLSLISQEDTTTQQVQPTPQKPEAVQPEVQATEENVPEENSVAQEQPDETEQPEEPDETEQSVETVEGEEEIEVVVTGEQETGYSVPNATTATKTDTPLRDIPQSIQVIPREVIEDRQVVRFSELAENVSGVQPQAGYFGLSSQGYYLRGFPLEFESFRNGFRDFGFISPRDVANVERVEFLKGPASVLYGGGLGFSGVVNTVTKKPQAEPFYRVDGTIGNYDFYRSTLDFTGPLTEDKSLLYRLNVAYENADSFRDFNENESIFVAPALTWQIGPRTTLTTEFEYQNYDFVPDRGLLPSEVFFDLPISRFLGEPDLDDAEFDSFSGTYNFEHEFSDNWKFRQGFNAIKVSGDTISAGNSNFSEPYLEEDGRTLPRRVRQTDESQENYTLQNEIFGKFETGSLRHNVLFGVELARYKFAYDFFRGPIAPIDIFAPVYGAEPGTLEPNFAEEYGADNIGIYVQDLIEILPNLKLLAGGRFDWVDSFYRDTLTNEFDFEQSDSEFSPRLGIVYQPSETTSLYASWSNSFNPQFFSRNLTGQPFEPTTGEQFEIGVKQEFFDNRLSATLALYQLTKKNVLTTDPEDPDFSIQTGEQKSRGVELDIAGEILPGWRIIATYAYTDAFVSEDNNIPEGDRLQGVPEHSASLWTTYEIQSGNLQGLGFGAGLVFASDREVELPNTIELSSYVRADASIFYRQNNWRAALNFKNLFDTRYYNTQGFYITPAAPFTVLGTLSLEF
jgi:iron complex outermembrane receptor protein